MFANFNKRTKTSLCEALNLSRAKMEYDCIVVGIGGFGSASIAHLAKSGLKVLGIEKFGSVHCNGKIDHFNNDFMLQSCN